MLNCTTCSVPMIHKVLSKCPDGTPGCLVAHYGYVCPHCGLEVDPFAALDKVKRKEYIILGPDDPNRPSIGFPMVEKIDIE